MAMILHLYFLVQIVSVLKIKKIIVEKSDRR